jgi:hypothetical protein
VLLPGQGTRERNLCSQNLRDDVVRYLLGGQPNAFQDLLAGAVVQELNRQAHLVQGSIHACRAHFLPDPRAHAAGPDAVLNADHQPVVRGQRNDGTADRKHPARVHDGGADALRAEPVGDVQGKL